MWAQLPFSYQTYTMPCTAPPRECRERLGLRGKGVAALVANRLPSAVWPQAHAYTARGALDETCQAPMPAPVILEEELPHQRAVVVGAARRRSQFHHPGAQQEPFLAW